MARSDQNGMTNAARIAYGELIKRQRKEKKMNQEELGSRPDVGSVPVICEALGLSLEEFFGFPDKSGESGEYSGISGEERADLLRRYGVLNPYNRQVIMRQMDMLHQMKEDTRKPRKIIRLFRNELAASAGPGETLEATRGEEVFLFADQETADEIIRVNGNSMEPTFMDGDLVLVKHTSRVRPGEIGVFICGDTGYIKEYREDGLHSHNPAYAPLVFSENEPVHCVGRVLGRVREDAWADDESVRAWQEYEQKGR